MKHVTLTGSRYAGASARGLGRRCSAGSSRSCRASTSARWLPRPGDAPRRDDPRVHVAHGGQRIVGCVARADWPASRESMGKVTGFIEIKRKKHPTRPVEERIHDWREVYLPYANADLQAQGARCMDCGIPFCHQGCPLGNLIPDWNDLVYRDRWHAAIDRLHATNNFPEFTGRLCPAPCEGSCVLGINRGSGDDQGDRGVDHRSCLRRRLGHAAAARHRAPGRRSRSSGPGPAGLAAADQLNRAGHSVTVFEKSDRIGGLLRYGIPEFKMEKRVLDRRLAIMEAEGVIFRGGVNVGARRAGRPAAIRFRRGAAGRRRGPAARSAGAGPRACRASTSRWST